MERSHAGCSCRVVLCSVVRAEALSHPLRPGSWDGGPRGRWLRSHGAVLTKATSSGIYSSCICVFRAASFVPPQIKLKP